MIILLISHANYSIQQGAFEAFVPEYTWELWQGLQNDIFKRFPTGDILRSINLRQPDTGNGFSLRKKVICLYNLNTVWNKSHIATFASTPRARAARI